MVFQSDTDGFHRNFPKEEKLIDIGFLNLGFSQEFGSIFYWTVGFGLFGFSGYLDIYTNQLLVQIYNRATACTMALLPFFGTMVITAGVVNHRINV